MTKAAFQAYGESARNPKLAEYLKAQKMVSRLESNVALASQTAISIEQEINRYRDSIRREEQLEPKHRPWIDWLDGFDKKGAEILVDDESFDASPFFEALSSMAKDKQKETRDARGPANYALHKKIIDTLRAHWKNVSKKRTSPRNDYKIATVKSDRRSVAILLFVTNWGRKSSANTTGGWMGVEGSPLSIEVGDPSENWANTIQKGNSAGRLIRGIRNSKERSLALIADCLLYTSPSPRDRQKSRMPSSA